MSKKFEVNILEESQELWNLTRFNPETAYIKQESVNNDLVWAIYNEQGEKLGYAASREVAFAVVNQNEFTGLSVHW